MMTREERRRAVKKLRREAKKRGENVQKRSRNRWTISTGLRIIKICWGCAGTGFAFRSVKPLRFESCAACGGAGGVSSN